MQGPTLREKSRMTPDNIHLFSCRLVSIIFGKPKLLVTLNGAKSSCVHRVIVFHCRILDFCAWFGTLWCGSSLVGVGKGFQPSYLCQKVVLMLGGSYSSLVLPPWPFRLTATCQWPWWVCTRPPLATLQPPHHSFHSLKPTQKKILTNLQRSNIVSFLPEV